MHHSTTARAGKAMQVFELVAISLFCFQKKFACFSTLTINFTQSKCPNCRELSPIFRNHWDFKDSGMSKQSHDDDYSLGYFVVLLK